MTQPRASGDIFPLLIYLDHYTQVAPHLSTHPEAVNGFLTLDNSLYFHVFCYILID